MTQIKICGLTNLEDAKTALKLGANALGFNFFETSSRCVSPPEAQAIVRRLPPQSWLVGVFVNQSRDEVERIARQVGLDTLQFHGDEDVDFCTGWNEWRVIKAVRLKDDTSVDELRGYKNAADYLLFDRFDRATRGGTGKEIDSEILDRFKDTGLFDQAFLAGGLNPDNVAAKVAEYRPFGVDVATGVEAEPGRKDNDLVQRFISSVQDTRAAAA